MPNLFREEARRLMRLILWAAAGVVVVGGAVMAVFMAAHSLSWRSRPEILEGTDPSRRALIVYQPGLSPRTRDVARTLAQGLNATGFTVTLDRPGRHLPVDLTAYRVVAFGSPVYAGQTSWALRRYMASITAWGTPDVVLFTVGVNPYADNTASLAELVPAEAIRHRVKFHRGAEDRLKALELGRTLGSGD